MQRAKQSGRGFSLIELLVVISIIALLVSLILPSLSSSREMAKSMQCSANLRQIGTGFQIYADSYQDYIPGSTVTRSAGNYIDLLGNSGAVGSETKWTMYSGGSTYANVKNWKVFSDPSEKPYDLEPGSSFTNSVVWHNSAQDYSYGSSYQMNWSVSQYSYGKPRKGWNKGAETSVPWNVSVATPFNPSQMTTPSTAAILVDCQAYYLYFLDEIDRYGPASGSTSWLRASHAFRHPSMTANVLFMDGHVQPKKHYSETGERVWRYLWAVGP